MENLTLNTIVKTEQEFEEFKSWTLGLLHDENIKSGVCVTFTKKDGTERQMQCTLCESRIPENKRPKSEGESQNPSTSGSALRVFDIELGEWRSFRWDSIKSIHCDII